MASSSPNALDPLPSSSPPPALEPPRPDPSIPAPAAADAMSDADASSIGSTATADSCSSTTPTDALLTPTAVDRIVPPSILRPASPPSKPRPVSYISTSSLPSLRSPAPAQSKSLLRRSLTPPDASSSSTESASVSGSSSLAVSATSSAATSTSDVATTRSPDQFGSLPNLTLSFRTISFAPLPITECRSRSGQLGIAGRARMLKERRSRVDGAAGVRVAPAPPGLAEDSPVEVAPSARQWPKGVHGAPMVNVAELFPRAEDPSLIGLGRRIFHSMRRQTSRHELARQAGATVDDGALVFAKPEMVWPSDVNDTEREGRVWEEEVSPDFLARHFPRTVGAAPTKLLPSPPKSPSSSRASTPALTPASAPKVPLTKETSA